MRVQKCKGTRDILPAEMRRFRHIESIFRNYCLKWGYQEIKTPTIEYLHLFTSTGTLTPGTLTKVYSFLDWDGWSGERVVLRPDVTIPVARSYIDGMRAEKLARLFYVTNTFIFEETGKETRERWQCGAELIGADSTTADIELISIALETLRSIGLDNIKISLSHAGIIRAILAGFGLSSEEQGKIFAKVLDGDITILNQLKTKTPELMRLLTPLLDLKGKSSGFLKNLKATFNHNLPEFTPALNNFIAITDLLTAMKQDYEIDISSGRGFEYYTGLIFQFFIGDTKVGAGGRYDALIPLMGGDSIPACGFALYIDPLMKAIKPVKPANDKILITVSDEKPTSLQSTLETIKQLHKAGFITVLDLNIKEKETFKWKLEIRQKAPRYLLSGKSGKNKREAPDIDAVLKLLGGKGAH